MMLLSFAFDNYRSFQSEAVLTMQATSSREHPEQVLREGKYRALPVAAIFGPNGSGKTNVLKALDCMRSVVLSSFDSSVSELRRDVATTLTPFMLDPESRTRPSQFEVSFTYPMDPKRRIITYGFTVQKGTIEQECLYLKAPTTKDRRLVFERDSTSFSAPGLPEEETILLKRVIEPKVLLASAGARLKVPILSAVYRWFRRINSFSKGLLADDTLLDAVARISLITRRLNPRLVAHYLTAFDPSISSVNPLKVKRDKETHEARVFIGHQEHETDETILIPLEDESAGIQKMLGLYEQLYSTLSQGRLMLADELSARLHPDLVGAILKLFMDPELNPNRAQLVFTTHETSLLDLVPFRRDEVWFTEKSESGASKLFSLADLKTVTGKKARNDYNHEKQYLNGAYGAKPVLKELFQVGKSNRD